MGATKRTRRKFLPVSREALLSPEASLTYLDHALHLPHPESSRSVVARHHEVLLLDADRLAAKTRV